MTSNVDNPYPYFTDRDGEALSGGKVYIGTAGTNPVTNQIAVFLDAALTIPAAQPIRTNGGYPQNGNSPTELFVSADNYSVLVLDRDDRVVSINRNVSRLGFDGADIEYAITAAETAAGATVVVTSREAGDIRRYGAVSGADSRQAILDAINQCAEGGAEVYIPAGEWRASRAIDLRSNISIRGEGRSSWIRATGWLDATFAFIYANKDSVYAPFTNIYIRDIRVSGALNGATPSHSNQGAAILIAYVDGCRLDRIICDQADDANIRIEGYRTGTVFPLASSDPDVNADLGHATNVVVNECTCFGGAIGLEIEGGASVQITNNNLDTDVLYGLRYPRAKECIAVGNVITSSGDNALWVDYANRCMFSNNFVKTMSLVDPCCSVGRNKDVRYENNTFVGGTIGITDSDFVGAAFTTGGSIEFAGNRVITPSSAGMLFNYHDRIILRGNNVDVSIRVETDAKAIIEDNVGTVAVSPDSKLMVNGGDDVIACRNYSQTTMRPQRTEGGWAVMGATVTFPTSGTHNQGETIFRSGPDGSQGAVMVCLQGGVPGIWEEYGWSSPGNYAEFYVKGDATGVTDRPVLTITVPNDEVFLMIEAVVMVHRQPNSAPGTAEIQRAVFSIGRQAGSDVVIDTYTGVGEYTKTSTTAGGGNNVAAMNLELARTGVEAAGDPQVCAVRMDVGAGLRNYNAQLRVLGELNGTTFVKALA